ncbi:SDR family oxidoreductase [Asaia krungthepensis]|uniref:Short-chain dehydrogenase n=1 Tax=Asaia krungthepensis NRIC 0535 TaxID=1307925 RepID=A0ABQ0Q3G3_9PROT|nr:SDR family NAD(P)-dependent oxidoreductase [Asaia krungthepensis]GBQ89463.1 short-chain dehydrogenase [Asaia krungthepensis NRIC 0535]
MKMSGNTILITGGTSGIGRALAEAFHDRGNNVIVTGRRQALLDEIGRKRPGIVPLLLDLADEAALAALPGIVKTHFPTLNIVIANAGISHAENLADGSWQVGKACSMIDTNIMGVLRIAAALLPILQQQENATFMATGSALAFVPRAAFPTYCATKAFLHSWLQSLRHQLKDGPVEVFELSPPYVQTALTGQAQLTDPRAMSLAVYTAQVMAKLERNDHEAGEILLPGDDFRRHAERDGRYEAVFSQLNPG